MVAVLQMDSLLLSHQGSPSGMLKVKMLVTQSCPTLCNPIDCNLPGSSIHGILQANILEWIVIPFSRGSSWPKDQTQVSCIAGRFFTIWASREAPIDYVSHKKEWNNAICSNMDEPRDDYTKSYRERQIWCDIIYMENLKKIIQMNLFTKQK